MTKRFLSIRVLLAVLCCAVLFGGVLLGSTDRNAASAAAQDTESAATASYTISYEDFNHVKPGPSITMAPTDNPSALSQ